MPAFLYLLCVHVFQKRVKSKEAGGERGGRKRKKERGIHAERENSEREMRGVRRKAVLVYTARACR